MRRNVWDVTVARVLSNLLHVCGWDNNMLVHTVARVKQPNIIFMLNQKAPFFTTTRSCTRQKRMEESVFSFCRCPFQLLHNISGILFHCLKIADILQTALDSQQFLDKICHVKRGYDLKIAYICTGICYDLICLKYGSGFNISPAMKNTAILRINSELDYGK